MATFHGQETTFDGNLTEEAIERMKERVDDALMKPAEGGKKLASLKQQYMASREHMVCSDHALRSITTAAGLNHFLVGHLPSVLGENEERFDVDLCDLPAAAAAFSKDQGFRKRLAIENTTTGETRLAVHWGKKMPSYWKWTDQGSDAWVPTIKIFYDFRLRGGEVFDPPHRHVRNREKTISQTNGGRIKVEWGVNFAWLRGPWKSEGNLQMLKGGAHELFRNFDHNFRFFKLIFYARICRSMHQGKLPAGFGTEEHMKVTWAECKDDKVLNRLGEDYSPCRWKSWSDRFAYYDSSLDVLLMIITYILITRGVCKNIELDLPGLKGLLRGLDAVGGVEAPADAILDLDLKSLKESSRALEAKRHKGSSGMLVVAESIANTTTRKLGQALWKVPEIVEIRMLKDISDRKSKEGAFNFHVGQACGDQAITIKRMFNLLEDQEFLCHIGFLRPQDVTGPNVLREDRVVTDFIWDPMRNVAVNEIATAAWYRDRPPFAFQNVRHDMWKNGAGREPLMTNIEIHVSVFVRTCRMYLGSFELAPVRSSCMKMCSWTAITADLESCMCGIVSQ